MAISKKYWETETPQVFQTEKNEIRVFEENGKIQVYPRVPNTPNGVGRGATIDIASMTAEELVRVQHMIDKAIRLQLQQSEAEAI